MPALARAISLPEPEHREARFREIYREHAATVRRIVFRLCGANDVDDVVQLTFVKVYEALSTLKEETALRAWVCRIAVNTARDHLRWRKRTAWLRFLSPEAPEPVAVETPADQRLASDETIRRALDSLSPKLRETLVLFSIEELSLEEIGSALGVPEGTVKSRLNQAREQLRLAKEDDDE